MFELECTVCVLYCIVLRMNISTFDSWKNNELSTSFKYIAFCEVLLKSADDKYYNYWLWSCMRIE